MDGMEERGEAFENRFFHDETLRFRAKARGCRLMGLWAAEKLGLTGEKAESYAKETVAAGVRNSDDTGIIRRISNDFRDANIPRD